jgi:hypothetical protein
VKHLPPRLTYSLLLFITLFVLWEVRPHYKARAYKELVISGGIMLLALVYGIDYIIGSQLLPNPNVLIALFKPLSQSIENFFQVTG